MNQTFGLNRERLLPILMFLLLLCPALCYGASGVYKAYPSMILAYRGKVTTGTVVEFKHSGSQMSAARSSKTPIVEYMVDGNAYRFTGNIASRPSPYELGQSVEVLYDPQDPALAQINTLAERWIELLALLPAIIILVLVMPMVLVPQKRNGS